MRYIPQAHLVVTICTFTVGGMLFWSAIYPGDASRIVDGTCAFFMIALAALVAATGVLNAKPK